MSEVQTLWEWLKDVAVSVDRLGGNVSVGVDMVEVLRVTAIEPEPCQTHEDGAKHAYTHCAQPNRFAYEMSSPVALLVEFHTNYFGARRKRMRSGCGRRRRVGAQSGTK